MITASRTQSVREVPAVMRQRLYVLWEGNQWSATEIDLGQDRLDWQTKLTARERTAFLYTTSLFLHGEASVTANLAPFLAAATCHEDRIFLATQVADEARHHTFFDRFIRDVAGDGHDMSSALLTSGSRLADGFTQLLRELDHATDQLTRQPFNKPLLVQAIMLYHILVEGLAQVGLFYLTQLCTRTGLLVGLRSGIRHITQDESRHVAFGVLWLRELVSENEACRTSALKILRRALPWAIGSLFGPGFTHTVPEDMRLTLTYAIRMFESRLGHIGIALDEVPMLVRLGHEDPPEDQASRVIALAECGLLGKDTPVHATDAALDAIFLGIKNAALHWRAGRREGLTTLQWIFDDGSARYVELGGTARAAVGCGIARQPTIRLRCSMIDWLEICMGHLNVLNALASGQLRIEGDWRLLFWLARLVRY